MEHVVVTTVDGDVRGMAADGVNSFRGIPFAAAPFGANRFRAPQPVDPWQGVRDALRFGPTPVMVPRPPPFDAYFDTAVVPGDDYLNLNVWTPELGSARLPVMVWIHGGNFENGTGSSPWYDGGTFARDGIVCVTLNYRVGADGFVALDDGDANAGILDQLAALRWVHENIAAFGGDPGNVTIFGESAGGMSVGTLLSMPGAEGLFRRAIAQSGAAHHVLPAETASRIGRRLAENLGVEPTREAMATVPSDRLVQAQLDVKAELFGNPDPERWGRDVVSTMMLWQPVVDGDVIPARPIDRIASGAAADIDVMVGTTTEEWRLFLVPGGLIDHVTIEAVAAVITFHGLSADKGLAHYRAGHLSARAGDMLSAAQTDWFFRLPALRLADAHATSDSATYMYEFAWRSPRSAGQLGSCHALEIPFVFDTLEHSAPLCGRNPPQHLADTMHGAWAAFARDGDPGWPRYDLDRKATMRFDTRPEVLDDPRAAERALWDGVR